MRKHDLQSATRIFVRFRSNQAVLDHGNLNNSPSLHPKQPINLLEPTPRIAPYTPVPRSLVPAVVGVLAGPEAGGDPPFASVYPTSRHGRQMRVGLDRNRETVNSKDTIPPSPQDLWTRALTLASKDVKSITSKMLVYFFERGKASYRPWSPTVFSSNHSNAGSNTSVVDSNTHLPILDHTVRLTLSHYTTLIHGLLLRRHYSVALSWVRKLIYPFPTFPTYTSSHFKHLPRASNLPRYSRESVHLSLDGTALSACLLVLARLGRVHEAIAVLEAYAAPSIIPSTLGLTLSARHTNTRNVQLNTIQMNDFLLTLLRWPTKKHALPVPSADFPLPLKLVKAGLSSTTFDKSENTRNPTEKDTLRTSSWLARTTDSTRSARPDLLLRILPALYPRYDVSWDSRTVCLMLQAVRMSAKMDGISAFGLRKVIKDIFAGSTKIKRKGMLDESLQLQSNLELTRGPDSVDRQSWLIENIMEVLWQPVGDKSLPPSSPSPFKLSITKASKKIKKKERPLTHTPRQSSLRPLEYGAFTPWPVTVSSPPPSPTLTFDNKTDTGSDTHFPYPTLAHPFLLAREIFLRLVWEHAASFNINENADIDLHALPSPAVLPPSSLARLLDPDGDGLGHLGGLPKWFGLLEGTLKRKFGFGSKLLTIPSILSSVSGKANPRMKLVDEVFGYPEDPHSPTLPKLSPIAFHHYILMLGLSAPEPWEFVQTGWNQRYPFQGYPHSIGSTYISTNTMTRSTSPPSSGPFTSCTSTPQTTRGIAPAISSLSIPGPSEIPITLSYMRALRLVPTKDTLCAAIVFWREAVGGETLAELGVREYKMSSMERGDEEEEDAYTREYETWKVNVEPPESRNSLDYKEGGQGSGKTIISETGTMGEYAKFCRWIREWVEELNEGTGTGGKTTVTMPHPYHIHRWAGIVRKMREGQGYDSEDDNM
ncbi:hypothetical protein F5876DRAFT_76222 [Lentinula aff. lateritia]|uniref:Uncharacterized protein n=1 Tax=Lentinula aff. lateritia TaxID=2804960 RepID=A0ACC1U257_9AGAR|nr:hypothetical protein F5876DRAFT_76222 [Lentinula aff. lateritia]